MELALQSTKEKVSSNPPFRRAVTSPHYPQVYTHVLICQCFATIRHSHQGTSERISLRIRVCDLVLKCQYKTNPVGQLSVMGLPPLGVFLLFVQN